MLYTTNNNSTSTINAIQYIENILITKPQLFIDIDLLIEIICILERGIWRYVSDYDRGEGRGRLCDDDRCFGFGLPPHYNLFKLPGNFYFII